MLIYFLKNKSNHIQLIIIIILFFIVYFNYKNDILKTIHFIKIMIEIIFNFLTRIFSETQCIFNFYRVLVFYIKYITLSDYFLHLPNFEPFINIFIRGFLISIDVFIGPFHYLF